jgi:hypothetical protein
MIVSMAYEYLDKKKEIYEKYFKFKNRTFYERQKPNDDMEKLKFDIKDDNGKILIRGTYSIIGFFNNFLSTWYWGWAVPFPVKSENYLSRKMLMYALDIDIDTHNNSINTNSMLKAELLNSKIFMENPNVEIEKYIALALYVTKSEYYYNVSFQSINIVTGKKETIGEVYYFLRDIEIIEKV